MKILRVDYSVVYVDPYKMLEKLEFDYCLPKCFWSDSEWRTYTARRLELLRIRNEMEKYNDR